MTAEIDLVAWDFGDTLVDYDHFLITIFRRFERVLHQVGE